MDNPYQLSSYGERILSKSEPVDGMPSVKETVVHELGNYIQPLLREDEQKVHGLVDAYEKFTNNLEVQESAYARAEALRKLENTQVDSSSCEHKLKLIVAGLKSAEAYQKMQKGNSTGPAEVDDILESFEPCGLIDINYNGNRGEEIDAGLEIWYAVNTLRKNTEQHAPDDAQGKITVEDKEDNLVFSYTDTGEGISEYGEEELFSLDELETGLPTLSEIVIRNDGYLKYEEGEDWQLKMQLPKAN